VSSHSGGPASLVLRALGVAVLAVATPRAGSGQETELVNLYRFVLDLEVPESPALVALGLVTSQALAATAPKPLGMSVAAQWHAAGRSFPAAAFELSPYFLVGGGRRTLERYRSNSVRGRLGRIGGRTVVSLGVAGDPVHTGAVRIALGLRATLHDPHDPINNAGGLPELVSTLLPGNVSVHASDIRGHSDAVDRSLTEAARAMRARPRWIVSMGYGVAGSVHDGTLERGKIDSGGHTLWLAWQRTLDDSFDLLFTSQALRMFSPGADFRIASALRRKTAAADVLADVYYDTQDRGLHGGMAFSIHLARGIRTVLSLGTEPETDDRGVARKLRVRSLLRWSYGS
jgi:hypothetical protein